MTDFILFARPVGIDTATSFGPLMQALKRKIAKAFPELRWQADFELGTSQHVDVFSVPSVRTAVAIEQFAKNSGEVYAEVTPLRRPW